MRRHLSHTRVLNSWNRAKNWRPNWRKWRRDPRLARWSLIVAIPAFVIGLALVFFEWNMLRGPLASYLSSRTGREVHIDGDLAVDLGWSPVVTVGGLRVANPDWVSDPDMAVVDQARVQFELMPLFIGRLILPAVEIQRPQIALVREESGRANWQARDGDGALRLPIIHSLRIDEGRVTIDDAVRAMTFDGTVNAREGTAQEGDYAFFMEGKGSLNRRRFLMEVQGDPLLNVSHDNPYGFVANFHEGATHVIVDGSILEPFDFGGIEARLTVNGSDAADLYHLTGLVLPNTAPYRISGGLTRNGDLYRYHDFSGRVGDSDMQGTLNIDMSGERPVLEGTLHSRRLDFDDLGTVLGAPPDPSETAAPEQRAEAAKMQAEQRLLPDAPLAVERVRKMDAKVRYTADAVNAPNLPLTKVVVGVELKNGVLVVDPMSFSMTRGALGGRARIDARRDIPATDVDLVLNNARLEEFFDGSAGEVALTGPIEARMKLSGRGLSVHQMASNAGGQFAVAIPGGEIRKTIAELLGVNVASALGLILAGDESKTELRCSVADFQVRDGLMTAQTFVFDTGPVVAKGSGTINLETETLDLRLEGEPKDPQLIRLIAPITIQGKLRHPQIGVEAGAALAQVGVAGAIATLLSPLAAVLPFLSPGLADDADCGQLVAQARQEGVPVAGSAASAPASAANPPSLSEPRAQQPRRDSARFAPPPPVTMGTPLPREIRERAMAPASLTRPRRELSPAAESQATQPPMPQEPAASTSQSPMPPATDMRATDMRAVAPRATMEPVGR